MNKKSFTLIELLVVIAIIGILSSLVILNITTGRDEANNARRVQEVNGLVKALAIYENQYGFSGLTTLSTTLREVCNTNVLDSAGCLALDQDVVDLSGMGDILANIPVDPSLPSDNPTTGYWVAKNYAGNEPMVVPGLYKANCPTGYISVPGNSYYNTLPGFCVMKWEAKNDGSGNAVSTAAGFPWVSISQINAKTECSDIGSHLITNNEWMTIARNIEGNKKNWADEVVGSAVVSGGGFFRGSTGENNSVGCGPGDQALSGEDDGINCMVGSRNKRMHYLTNDEEVWDISGNVYNWTDDIHSGEIYATEEWRQWNESSHISSSARGMYGPSNSDYTSSQGVGLLRGGAVGRAFIRGGRWSTGTLAGVFALSLQFSLTSTQPYIGFRCAQ